MTDRIAKLQGAIFQLAFRRFVFSGGRIIVFALTIVFCARNAHAAIDYSISLANPDAHLFHVTMTIPEVHGKVVVQMPAWNATYQIRDFASRVQGLMAKGEKGEALPVQKLDKQSWRIIGDGKLTITYADVLG